MRQHLLTLRRKSRKSWLYMCEGKKKRLWLSPHNSSRLRHKVTTLVVHYAHPTWPSCLHSITNITMCLFKGLNMRLLYSNEANVTGSSMGKVVDQNSKCFCQWVRGNGVTNYNESSADTGLKVWESGWTCITNCEWGLLQLVEFHTLMI